MCGIPGKPAELTDLQEQLLLGCRQLLTTMDHKSRDSAAGVLFVLHVGALYANAGIDCIPQQQVLWHLSSSQARQQQHVELSRHGWLSTESCTESCSQERCTGPSIQQVSPLEAAGRAHRPDPLVREVDLSTAEKHLHLQVVHEHA